MPLFAKTCDYSKLKSNLRLCNNRMGLLQKKKTEIGVKTRREIAELLKQGKVERCRIKTEQIVREDYVVEVMEILQTYCDLLLTRFGIFESSKEVDAGLEEAIATLIWCSPRLSAEVVELSTINRLFAEKYSKEYVEACTENRLKKVNPVVIQKLDLIAPSPALVEMYMMEIARTYEVDYTPNLDLLNSSTGTGGGGTGSKADEHLIDFEPDTTAGLPNLPQGYAALDQTWEHGTEPGVDAPYPERSPFPAPPEPTQPPAPQQLPSTGGPTNFYGYGPGSPPSYDAAMFPDKSGAVEDAPPLPSAAPVPSTPQQPPATGNDAGADDEDFDELQRRFQMLTNRK
ncbi:Increased sodium tolerance 1 [Paragonimus heterotremus]|uniref:IST1 homolog n=1 Tax=Paragonimus heterotremus TaxID=100268 RepID=A0A8J4WE64_9TREM|nr:Increased sodium tolerance 1 [Paragonimus heterotremus]